MDKNKIIVIKFGGSLAVDQKIKSSFFKDIVTLRQQGYQVVICHGGGPQINFFMQKLGLQPKFINGLRVTDAATMEAVEMVLSGKINREIVGSLNSYGTLAMGLSGKDAKLLEVKKLRGKPDLGFVGEIQKVNTKFLTSLIKEYVVVISSLGVDRKGQTYNINADEAATKVAQAVKARKLLLLTNVKGVLANPAKADSTIDKIKSSQVSGLIEKQIVTGGMIPKIQACRQALRQGVGEIDILDGRVPHVVLKAIKNSTGLGTCFTRG